MNYAGIHRSLHLATLSYPCLFQKFHNLASCPLLLALVLFTTLFSFQGADLSGLFQGQIETLTSMNASIQSRYAL